MNALLDRLFALVRAHACILCIGIGMGIYRCAHEWPVWFGETYLLAQGGSLPFNFDVFLFVDIGKVAGVIAYVAACYRLDKAGRNGFLLVVPSAVLLAGYALSLPCLFSNGIFVPLVLFCLVACGIGAGMLFAQWIEVCGRLSPLNMIEAARHFVSLAILAASHRHRSDALFKRLADYGSCRAVVYSGRLLPATATLSPG